MIYFIEAAGAGAVKIGWVNADLPRRLQQLQCGSPHDLVVAGTVPGTRRMEQKLHLGMVGYTVRGEWFEAEAAKSVYARILAVGFEQAIAELAARVDAIRADVQRAAASGMARVNELWPELAAMKRGRSEAFVTRLVTAPIHERQKIIEVTRGSQLVALGKGRKAA